MGIVCRQISEVLRAPPTKKWYNVRQINRKKSRGGFHQQSVIQIDNIYQPASGEIILYRAIQRKLEEVSKAYPTAWCWGFFLNFWFELRQFIIEFLPADKQS